MQGCAAAPLSRGNSVRATLNHSRYHLIFNRDRRGGNRKPCHAILRLVGVALGTAGGAPRMRDYVKSRPAKVGEKLRTQHFHPGTVGFAAPEDAIMAVRVLP